MKKIAFYILLGFAVSTLLYSCARKGIPTGGPLDHTPPKVTLTKPLNYSTNFKGGKVEIFFDEFVQLKDISSNFTISPPLKKKPLVKLKGRSIYVKLEEKLRENTTYTLDFGKGIADNNEGNPLGEYQFVFSTGNQLDSLSIKGKLDNSFNQLPVEKAMVMAYLNTNDSVPFTVIPSYVAKTDSAGYFQLNNLSSGDYKLFAIVDGNRDFLYNGPGEMIGFSNDIITPKMHTYEQLDSINADSVIVRQMMETEPSNIYLRMFDEENPLQYLTTYKRDRREQIYFEFNSKRTDSLKIDFIDVDENPNWFLLEKNRTNDTLSYWITDSTIYQRDTLLAKLEYLKTDSLGKLVSFTDTVKLNYKAPKKAKASRNKKKQAKIKIPTYGFKLNASSSQDLNKDVILDFNEPLAEINKDSIHLYQLQDTILIPVDYKIEQDSAAILRYHVKIDWKAETQYKVEFDSTAFRNIYGLYSDKYNGKITTREEEYYGKILLNVSNVKKPLIVQLLKNNKSEGIVQAKRIYSDQTVIFDYLAPDTYIIKLIVDENDNGKWDTGNYKEGLQPEMVHYFRKEIKVRSYFDVEDRIYIPENGPEINFNQHLIELEQKRQKKLEKALLKDAEKNKKKTRTKNNN
ncbi:MAG: Ig-like domain-containing protein [Marinifilaceae bacterium]|nr:Ig-like domain-containing protein [Marinifilaceae bacterium]